MQRTSLILLIAAAIQLAGCHGHRPYRTDATVCDADREACESNAVLHLSDAPVETLLGFAEFDDQGAYWDRALALSVIESLSDRLAGDSVILVAFAHGWKHNARASDPNLDSIQGILRGLANFEACVASEYDAKPRSVVGMYVGWRGGTIRVPLIKELTFWGRKKVAHKIGESAVQDLMLRLEQLYLSKRREEAEQAIDKEGLRQQSYLISLGHSFGGALLFSALSPMLLDRAYEQSRRYQYSDPGFGDLVVLVNPAFEARRFTELAELAQERTIGNDGPPVVATFSSEADWATRYAFPFGRWLGTLFQRYGSDPEQRSKNVNTLGHYRPYITHRLLPQPSKPAPCAVSADVDESATRKAAVDNVQRVREQLRPGGVTELTSAELRPTAGSKLPPSSPYIVVEVDKSFIDGHNDFANEEFQQFLIEFLTASALSPDYAER